MPIGRRARVVSITLREIRRRCPARSRGGETRGWSSDAAAPRPVSSIRLKSRGGVSVPGAAAPGASTSLVSGSEATVGERALPFELLGIGAAQLEERERPLQRQLLLLLRVRRSRPRTRACRDAPPSVPACGRSGSAAWSRGNPPSRRGTGRNGPDARQTCGCMMIVLSMPTISNVPGLPSGARRRLWCATMSSTQAARTLRFSSVPSGPVVPEPVQAAIDLARRKDEAAALGEADDVLHGLGFGHGGSSSSVKEARRAAPGPRWGSRPQTPLVSGLRQSGSQGQSLSGVRGQSPWPSLSGRARLGQAPARLARVGPLEHPRIGELGHRVGPRQRLAVGTRQHADLVGTRSGTRSRPRLPAPRPSPALGDIDALDGRLLDRADLGALRLAGGPRAR